MTIGKLSDLLALLLRYKNAFIIIIIKTNFCLLISKPRLLSRNDLQLEWKPLYDLLEKTSYSALSQKKILYFEPNFSTSLVALIERARIYFNANATSEMLSEWTQFMCIYSSVKYHKYLYLLRTFLPTLLPPEEHKFGHELWLKDLVNLWFALTKEDIVSHHDYVKIFSDLAKNALGYNITFTNGDIFF